MGDLLRGAGIDAAVACVGTILHLAGDAKGDDVATANPLRAAAATGVGHIVYISVTAAELLPVIYFRAKFTAEQVVAESGLPWTTLLPHSSTISCRSWWTRCCNRRCSRCSAGTPPAGARA